MISRCGLLLLMTGCTVELRDVAGRACDETHPCRAPRVCIDGRCLTPDAGEEIDAGIPEPRWEQRVHGFGGTTVDPDCSLTIDSTRENLVVASIAGPADDDDTALARVTDTARFATTNQGQLRGHLTFPLAVNVRGEVPVLVLNGSEGAWLRAGFDASGRLVVRSDANTLGDTEVLERFTVDGGFGARDSVLELAWQAGAFRRVTLDGQVLAETPVSGGSSSSPGELALGVERYDGDAGTAFTVRLPGWQLADSLQTRLGDAP
ncbi:MAG: hypothetical protein ACO1OB_29835 [Archangium sp.]